MRLEPAPTRSPDLDHDPRWLLVQRIAASPHFQKTARLRDFLSYVVAESIHGRGSQLNEHLIGCSVFGRPESYSPTDDNIVRVHARQLRSRLEEYFLHEGSQEPMVIEIPKGSYLPAFHPRAELPAAVAEARQPAATPSRTPLPFRLAVAAALLATAAAVWMGVQNAQLRGRLAEPAAESQPWLLAAILDRTEPTTVVIADSGFGALRSLIGSKPPLSDYLAPGYPENLIRPDMPDTQASWVRNLTNRPYTTFTSAMMMARLAQLSERNHWKVNFRFARDLSSRDFNEGRFLLIGSAIVNPWVSLFEGRLNFRSGWDPKAKRSLLHNLAPGPAEPAIYMPEAPNDVPGESYGAVSLQINPAPASHTGLRVLIIEGTNIESSDAAAKFAFDTAMSQEALRTAGGRPPANNPSNYRFEAVVSTRAVAGSSHDTRVAATRFVGGDR